MKVTKRNEKAITLIALIITIIILVILAAVSIRAVTSMGIVGHAINGTQDYAREGKKENEVLEGAGNLIEGALTNIGRIQSLDTWDGVTKTKPQADANRNWHIYTAAEMKYFADFVNGELTEEEMEGLEITEDTIVYLESNLDLGAKWDKDGNLTSGTAWTPVGKTKNTNEFIGTFEGQNCYIQGVYVNQEANFGGIFGNSNTIQNLTIKNSYIEGGTATGGIVGALRGGKVENCHNINTTVICKEGNYYTVGGVVGQISSRNRWNI